MRVGSHSIKGYLNDLVAGPEQWDGCEEVCMVLLVLMLNLFGGGDSLENCAQVERKERLCV